MPRFTPAYPPEFRAEAVQLLRIGGKPLAEIAPDLGASAESTAPWGPPGGDRPGPASSTGRPSHPVAVHRRPNCRGSHCSIGPRRGVVTYRGDGGRDLPRSCWKTAGEPTSPCPQVALFVSARPDQTPDRQNLERDWSGLTARRTRSGCTATARPGGSFVSTGGGGRTLWDPAIARRGRGNPATSAKPRS